MHLRQPPCPRCHNDLFVRTEWIISGRRSHDAHYCGHCQYEWQAEATPDSERRQGERRKFPRIATPARPIERPD